MAHSIHIFPFNFAFFSRKISKYMIIRKNESKNVSNIFLAPFPCHTGLTGGVCVCSRLPALFISSRTALLPPPLHSRSATALHGAPAATGKSSSLLKSEPAHTLITAEHHYAEFRLFCSFSNSIFRAHSFWIMENSITQEKIQFEKFILLRGIWLCA